MAGVTFCSRGGLNKGGIRSRIHPRAPFLQGGVFVSGEDHPFPIGIAMQRLSRLGLRALYSTSAADRVSGFAPSVWSEVLPIMARSNAINLGQGFPDFAPPEFVMSAMAEAARNPACLQYSRSQGALPLVEAISDHYSPTFKRQIDPLTEVLVTAGASQGISSALQALVNEGDEVILFEPFFDSYYGSVKLAGGKSVYVPLRRKTGTVHSSEDWYIDMSELASAITPKTKVILFNNPHNPVGKSFSLPELEAVAHLAQKHDLIVLSDEVYDCMTMDGLTHQRLASIDGMWERTVTLGSAGKSFSATGFKIGWATGGSALINAIWMSTQYTTYCINSPSQHAVAAAFRVAESGNYWQELQASIQSKRDIFCSYLEKCGLTPIIPQGTYFVMSDTSNIQLPASFTDTRRDYDVNKYLIESARVGGIPPGAFYSPENAVMANSYLRFCFVKKDEVLHEAGQRLHQLLSP